MKIFIHLRDPVDLVFSQWKWLVVHTEQRLLDRCAFLSIFSTYVETALELFPAVVEPLGVAIHTGIYANSVAHWLQAFGPMNIHVFDVAEYFRDRNTCFTRLQYILDLPHVDLPPQLPVTNSNPMNVSAPDPETSTRLRKFFEPYNLRLWDVIGTAYNW